MSINRIYYGPGVNDYYSFDDMIGGLQPKQMKVEVTERAGQPGESVWLLGMKALDSSVLTIRYVLDRQDAIDLVALYETLIDGNPYEVVQAGQSFGYFKVLQLQCAPLRPCVVAGSIVPNATIMQGIQWTLRSTNPP